MDDLTAFTAARLAEDEAAAAAASDGPWQAWRGRPGLGLRQLEHGVTLPGQEAGSLASIATASWMDAEHIARHDPARALREVTAKRARLAYYLHAQAKLDHIIAHPGEMSSGDEGMWLGKAAAARMACRYDAAIWSDHADYRPEWAPGHG